MRNYISEILALLAIAFSAGVWVTITKINNKNIDKISDKLDSIEDELHELKVYSSANNVKMTTMQNQIAKLAKEDNVTYL